MPPASSKNRSATTVSCARHRAQRTRAGANVLDRLLRPGRSSPQSVSSNRIGIGRRRDFFAQRATTACDSSRVRPGASPRQNGIEGAAPRASSTRTRPGSTRRMRQDVVPSRNTSPAMLSTAKSSSTRADHGAFRLRHHLVLRGIRNRAAAGDRRQPRAAPRRAPGDSPGRDAGTPRAVRAKSRCLRKASRPPRRNRARARSR